MSLKKTMNKINSGNSNEKRAKKLACLYAFSSLVVKNNITIDEILQGTIDLLPPASQYPETTSIFILQDSEIVYNNPEQKKHFSCLSRSFKLMDFN